MWSSFVLDKALGLYLIKYFSDLLFFHADPAVLTDYTVFFAFHGFKLIHTWLLGISIVIKILTS